MSSRARACTTECWRNSIFDHVEAEGLGLPDEVLQRAIGGAFVAGLGERTLHHAKIREEVVAVVVHEIGVALDRVMQAVGHDEHAPRDAAPSWR